MLGDSLSRITLAQATAGFLGPPVAARLESATTAHLNESTSVQHRMFTGASADILGR